MLLKVSCTMHTKHKNSNMKQQKAQKNLDLLENLQNLKLNSDHIFSKFSAWNVTQSVMHYAHKICKLRCEATKCTQNIKLMHTKLKFTGKLTKFVVRIPTTELSSQFSTFSSVMHTKHKTCKLNYVSYLSLHVLWAWHMQIG